MSVSLGRTQRAVDAAVVARLGEVLGVDADVTGPDRRAGRLAYCERERPDAADLHVRPAGAMLEAPGSPRPVRTRPTGGGVALHSYSTTLAKPSLRTQPEHRRGGLLADEDASVIAGPSGRPAITTGRPDRARLDAPAAIRGRTVR